MNEWEQAFDAWLRAYVVAWDGRIDHGDLIAAYMLADSANGESILLDALGEAKDEVEVD